MWRRLKGLKWATLEAPSWRRSYRISPLKQDMFPRAQPQKDKPDPTSKLVASDLGHCEIHLGIGHVRLFLQLFVLIIYNTLYIPLKGFLKVDIFLASQNKNKMKQWPWCLWWIFMTYKLNTVCGSSSGSSSTWDPIMVPAADLALKKLKLFLELIVLQSILIPETFPEVNMCLKRFLVDTCQVNSNDGWN